MGEKVIMNTSLLCGIQQYISEFDHIDEESDWSRLLQQILSFKYREFNWDGEMSQPPTEELVDSIISYLVALKQSGEISAPARAIVTDEGGIIIEWQYDDGIIELETDQPGLGELMFAPDGGETEFEPIDWRPADSSAGIYDSISEVYSTTTAIPPVRIYSAA